MKKKPEWIKMDVDAKEGAHPFKKAKSDKKTGKVKVFYKPKGAWRDKFSFRGEIYDTFEVPDAGHMMVVGAPMIPQAGLFVSIPGNAEVQDVKVLGKEESELPGEYYVVPSPEPTVEDEEDEYIPDPKIYESDEPFPGKDFELLGMEVVEDMKVAHIVVFLGQYIPKSKKMSMLKSLELEVVYKVLPDVAVRRGPSRGEMKDLIVNWEDMASLRKGGD